MKTVLSYWIYCTQAYCLEVLNNSNIMKAYAIIREMQSSP